MGQPSADLATAVCAAVALLAPAAVLETYGAAGTRAAQGDPFRIEQQVQRMSGVLSSVPANARVGYVSDVALDTNAGLAAFLSAEYALAPRQVVELSEAAAGDWVIGNFARPTDFTAFGAKRGLVFQSDLGNGVVLFRKAGG